MDSEIDFFAQEHAKYAYEKLPLCEDDEELDEFEVIFREQVSIQVREVPQLTAPSRKKSPKNNERGSKTFEKETGITLNTTCSSDQGEGQDFEEDDEYRDQDEGVNSDSSASEDRDKKVAHQKNLPQSVYAQVIKRFVSAGCRKRVRQLLRKEGLTEPDHLTRVL